MGIRKRRERPRHCAFVKIFCLLNKILVKPGFFFLEPFSGFLHLNVHDKVYAEAHVGIINYRVDILYIELCYRGRLEYNLNLLKVIYVDFLAYLVLMSYFDGTPPVVRHA